MKITPYISDILDQPIALERCLSELERRPTLKPFQTRLRDGRYRRIILTGMGSSFFAAIPLQYRLLRFGYDANLIETSELIQTLPELIAPENLLVVISQSGQSAEIIHLLELARNRADILAVTNGESSPLALGCQSAIMIRAGTENTVSCKTYLNTLAALTALGDDLTASAALLPQFDSAPQAVQDYLEGWTEHVAFLANEMADIDHLFLLGRGTSLASAQTGGLIIKESAHFPSQAMSAAAFRHGPMELTAPNVYALVFAGAPAVHEVNLRLALDIRHFGGSASLVESSSAPNSTFSLPLIPSAALPVLEMLPAQMLSLALAEKSGHEAGVFQFGSKVTTVL